MEHMAVISNIKILFFKYIFVSKQKFEVLTRPMKHLDQYLVIYSLCGSKEISFRVISVYKVL